ncbi:uncharacterized protein LOC115770344 [Drosophila novamexicana]|uniref:uncharacterized protein LOC115770344 n=1 Tax=Drosophila novamexicana TaxID=47314 RepID=UPI0011E5F776|nr:uncharacterized protein LOC115770344 [Drosophila novamexicana]
MFLICLYLLSTLPVLLVDSKDESFGRGKVKVLLESLQTNCDHDFVEYFHKSPVIETLYTFRVVFNAIIVNNTINGCPILPKVYFLKNMADPKVIPTFHPIGRYQTNVRIHMSQSPGPYVMEVIWRYNVVNVK